MPSGTEASWRIPGTPRCATVSTRWSRCEKRPRPFAPAVTIEQVHRWFEVAPMTELAVHDHHRGRQTRASCSPPGRHARERLGSRTDRQQPTTTLRSTRCSRSARPGYGPRNGPKYELQYQGSTDREYPPSRPWRPSSAPESSFCSWRTPSLAAPGKGGTSRGDIGPLHHQLQQHHTSHVGVTPDA